jgi:Leucine-rich repeat (LRR) protein
MNKNDLIDKTKSIVKNEYIWLSSSDDEMAPDLDYIEIDGVLQLDEWDETFAEFIKVNDIQGLELKGDKFKIGTLSLSILKELPELRYLRISGKFKKPEYKVIESLSRLEQLSIADYEAYELNFSKLKNLKSYFSPIKHIDHPIFHCKTLEYIGTNTNLEHFESFSNLNHLKEVYLHAKKIKSLNGIENIPNLRLLEIDYGSNLYDISSLSKLKNLEKLSLYGCKRLKSLEDVSRITNLRCLYFDECGVIESLRPLQRCKSIEYVSFGDTIIEDGDLECLMHIKPLKGVFFKNRRTYNKKIEDFKGYDIICK